MNNIEKACRALIGADALLIGASNGLSIAEGYHLFANNDMFQQQFGDFQRQYGIKSVLEGCFFDYPDEDARKSFVNRLIQYWIKDYHPSQVMKDLLGVVDDQDYFILTTNADTHFELSGLAPTRVFENGGYILPAWSTDLVSKTKLFVYGISWLDITTDGWYYWNWAWEETIA